MISNLFHRVGLEGQVILLNISKLSNTGHPSSFCVDRCSMFCHLWKRTPVLLIARLQGFELGLETPTAIQLNFVDHLPASNGRCVFTAYSIQAPLAAQNQVQEMLF